jgi:hypothetical protein
MQKIVCGFCFDSENNSWKAVCGNRQGKLAHCVWHVPVRQEL